MKPKAVTENSRRSKRQAGLDVSPQGSLTKREKRKNVPKVKSVNEVTEQEPRDSELEQQTNVEGDGTQLPEEHETERPEDDETEVPKGCETETPEDDETEVPKGCETRASEDDETQQPEDYETECPEQYETEVPRVDETQPPESTPSDTQTEQSDNKVKKTRGPTKMRKVAKHIEDKVEVEFNALGEHVGNGSVTLSSFLGPLVREHVPVLPDDWRQLEERTKDALWEEIQGRFNLTENWQKDVVFKQMGCLWRASKSRLTSMVRATKNKAQLQLIKPSNIQSSTAWNNWVKGRCSAAFQEESDKHRELRKGQIPHTTSRKGMNRLAHEMKQNAVDPKQVTRTKVWVAGHTHSDGRPVRQEFADTIEKIKRIDSEMESSSADNIGDDAVTQVLGKEKSGRVRGMGRGVTATKLAFLHARDAHVQKLEASQAELMSKVEDLQNVVKDLAGKKHVNGFDSTSELSDVSKGGKRCQILDWVSTEDLVVAEGEFYSSDPTYKIGRIPLGPNAAAVVVKSVSVVNAAIWRPTPTCVSLTQAIGVKIAWPAEKLILDDAVDMSKYSNIDGSEAVDASLAKVQIFDYWKL